MVLAHTMLNVEIVICKWFDSPRDLTDGHFKSAQPLQRTLVGRALK